MDKKTEALKLALEALENSRSLEPVDVQWVKGKRHVAITAIREALAEQPAQLDPSVGTQVSKVWWDGDKLMAQPIPLEKLYKEPEQPAQQELDELTAQRDKLADILTRTANALKGQPAELSLHSWHDLPEVAQQLKTAQQRKPWTGLTDEEIKRMAAKWFLSMYWPICNTFAREIEAKLREKNA